MDKIEFQQEGFAEKYEISVSFVFLSLFVLSSYISPLRNLGEQYKSLPMYLAVATLVVHMGTSLISNRSLFNINWTLLWLLVFAAFAFAISLNGVDPEHSKTILYDDFFKGIIIFILISTIINSLSEIKFFFYLLVFCGFFLAYTLINDPQYIQGRPYNRYTVFARDPNDLSMVLAYTAPFVLLAYNFFKNRVVKLLLLYASFTILLAILEARSRGAFLALLFFYLFAIKGITEQKKRVLVMVISLPLIIGLVYRYAPANYVWRMKEIVNIENDSTGSAQARSANMGITFAYAFTHPISKYGMGNNGYLIADAYGSTDYTDAVFHGDHAHNIFLQAGGDLGFVPLTFYLLFIASAFISLRKARRRLTQGTEDELVLCKCIDAIQLSFIIFLVAAFFLPVSYRLYVFYLAGFATAHVKVSKNIITQIEG